MEKHGVKFLRQFLPTNVSIASNLKTKNKYY